MTVKQPNFNYQAVRDELNDVANDANEPEALRKWARHFCDLMDNGAEMENISASVLVERLTNMNLRGSVSEYDLMGLPPDEIDEHKDAS